jgi:multiple sugar transport system substrate-binding protein
MKKFLAILMTTALMVSSLSACGTAENTIDTTSSTETTKTDENDTSLEQTEITFWHSYSEGEEKIFNETVLAAFEKEHPEIKVNAVRMPYEGLDEQLITAVSGDAAPDVMRMDLTWVAQMAKLGALECLDDYEGFDDVKANALEGSFNTTLYKGESYGLPLNANTTVAVYNNEMLKEYGFEEAPETLDELMGALEKTDPDNEKWLFAISGSYNWAMLPFIWTLGGSVTDENYTVASGYLNSQATVDALDTIVSWYNDGIIGPAIMGEQPDGWGGIEAGNYTMIVEGPWFFSSEDKLDTYTPALIPSVDGRSISIVGGEDIVMTSTSKKKDAAWTFMKFMLEDEQQIAMADAGMIPVTSSAMEKVDTTNSPYVDVYMEQLKTAEARIPCSSWPSIETILNTAFEKVLRGESNSQDALDEAAQEIDELLAAE